VVHNLQIAFDMAEMRKAQYSLISMAKTDRLWNF